MTDVDDAQDFDGVQVEKRSTRKTSDPTSWGSGSPATARGKMSTISLPEIVLEVL